jgi:HAD superfamily hydrolase (TIGR01509 family)
MAPYPCRVAVRAFLLDVYQTLVFSDFHARKATLAELADVDADQLGRELRLMEPEWDTGRLSIVDGIGRALELCGADPDPGIIEAFRDAHRSQTRLYGDSIPFLRELRSRGFAIALVSNCAGDTRPLLEEFGLLDLVDAAVLSCEVGYAKPGPEIYDCALASLEVAAGDAVFVDDQLRYCAGAVAAGLNAVQIIRDDPPPAAADGIPVVRSLFEALAGPEIMNG